MKISTTIEIQDEPLNRVKRKKREVQEKTKEIEVEESDEQEIMSNIMHEAIKIDNVETIKNILIKNNKEFCLKLFLNNNMKLLELYSNEFFDKNVITRELVFQISSFYTCNNSEKDYLKEASNIIKQLSDDMYDPKYNKDYATEYPELDLFIYSVFSVKPKISKLFWENLDEDQIFFALLASKIFKSIAKISNEHAKQLTEYADDYENLAYNVLDECNKKDPKLSKLLLVKNIPKLNSTLFIVAESSNSLKFMSHYAVQNLLTNLWYKDMSPNTSTSTLIMSAIFPFLAPLIIVFGFTKLPKLGKAKFEDTRVDLHGDYGLTQKQRAYNKSSKHNKRLYGFGMQLLLFFHTPIVKFIYSQISYFCFLMLFSYVLLCDFFPISATSPISGYEIVLIIWVIMFLFDEIRQMLESERLSHYTGEFWNIVDFIAILLFFIGLILRLIPTENYDLYMTARVIMSLDLALWYINTLSIFAITQFLGPKLVMIRKMMIELMYFIIIVIIFMFAFGVATQSLMYHNQELSFELLKQVFLPSYFIMGGEYYTRETIMGYDTCQQKNDSSVSSYIYTKDDCPDKIGSQFTIAIYILYVIMLNILLVNILIAIFNNTFTEIQNKSENVWKFQRYSTIYEYTHKPKLATPLNVISYTISAFRFIFRFIRIKCCENLSNNEENFLRLLCYYFSKEWYSGFVYEPENEENKKLIRFEKKCSNAVLECSNKKQMDDEFNDLTIKKAFKRVQEDNEVLKQIIKKNSKLLNETNEILSYIREKL